MVSIPSPPSGARTVFLRLLRWRILARHLRIFAHPEVRSLFHWQYSNGLILTLWGTVVAMVALAATLDNAPRLFNWAYFFAAAAFFWSLGSWLTSDKVQAHIGHRRSKWMWSGVAFISIGIHWLVAVCQGCPKHQGITSAEWSYSALNRRGRFTELRVSICLNRRPGDDIRKCRARFSCLSTRCYTDRVRYLVGVRQASVRLYIG